jgi:hypothetical protein
MPRYALIQNSVVINVILLNNPSDYPTTDTLVQSDSANIGDSWDGTNFIPSTPTPTPDWMNFNLAMLNNPACNRVGEKSLNTLATTDLRAIAITISISGNSPDSAIATIPQLWNAMIEATPLNYKPAAEEITGWNQIASNCSMLFTFSEQGQMVLNI